MDLFDTVNTIPQDLLEVLENNPSASSEVLKDIITDYCMSKGMGFLVMQKNRKEWFEEYEKKQRKHRIY